ncbi:MAG: hypothetical protein AAF431_07100 [Pseudomonadota bacterium]
MGKVSNVVGNQISSILNAGLYVSSTSGISYRATEISLLELDT